MDFVIKAGIQLTTLTSDLLDFAKISHDNKEWEKIRINGVLEVVQLNLFELIKKENAKILFSIDEEVVYGHRSDFILLFQNLIANAIKYRREDESPIIQIQAKPEGYKMDFSIQDNGCGIPVDKLDEIFVPFKRLYNENRQIEGSGIGLSTCQKIIEKYDSVITVKSEVGKGSSFSFSLPTVLNLTRAKGAVQSDFGDSK